MYFTDSHIQIVSRGVLEQGEKLVARGVAVHAPWWTFGIKLFHKTFLLLASDQRLVMIEHKNDFFMRGLKTDKVHSMPWSQVSELKVKGLFLKKKLRVAGQASTGPVKGTYRVPGWLLAPIAENLPNLRQMEQTAAATRQLGAPVASGAPAGYLASPQPQPFAAPYGAAPSSAPAPQYGAPPSMPPASHGYGAPPSMPPVNAMGYASVPPPPAPMAGPFSQPQPQQTAWPTQGSPGGWPPPAS